MIATLWRFRVPPAERGAFERAYGPNGDWARLFARAAGYAGTELLRQDDGAYLTIDRWHSRDDYQRARSALADEYAVLDRRCEAHTTDETWLGLYTIVGATPRPGRLEQE